jgi:23S rRNA pseudouridine1911/1915/1917 synthase
VIGVVSPYSELLEVLYEDNHMLAVHKPAGWASTHFDGNDQTIDQVAKLYLKEKYNKPGQVYLGIVHRLDKLTSGVLLFARTSKAAARLSEQFREGAVEKRYWAVTSTTPTDPTKWVWQTSGALDDWLWHDDEANRVRVVSQDTAGAKSARLLYEVKSQSTEMQRLELTPHTGRKHQIRVQLSSRGYPVLGDGKYGSLQTFGNFIALHARSLTVLHPITHEPIALTAEVPRNWKGRFAKVL